MVREELVLRNVALVKVSTPRARWTPGLDVDQSRQFLEKARMLPVRCRLRAHAGDRPSAGEGLVLDWDRNSMSS